MTGAQHFHDHARGGRAHVRDLAKRAVGLHERLDRGLEGSDGGGGPLVTPTARLGCLNRGQIAPQRGDGAVGLEALDRGSSPHGQPGEQIPVQPRIESGSVRPSRNSLDGETVGWSD